MQKIETGGTNVKRNGLLSISVVLAVMLVLGIGGVITGIKDKAELAKGIDDFNYLANSEFYEGKFVEGNVFEIYGEFAYTESYSETLGVKHNSKVTSHYYLIPITGSFEASTLKLIPVEIRTSANITNAELLIQQTFDFQDYGTEPDVWNEFTLFGKVSVLDGEVEEYLYSWLTNDGADGTKEDYKNLICPYIITEYAADAPAKTLNFSLTIAIIGALGLGVIVFIFVRSRRNNSPSQTVQENVYQPVNAPEADKTDTSGLGIGTGDDDKK